MKTLLVGGPRDGQIEDLARNVFGVSDVTVTTNKRTGTSVKSETNIYRSTSESVKHPCKKRGNVRVFRYVEP